MHEVKTPKKPLIYYYLIAMLLLLLFQFLAMPLLTQARIQTVDYNTFDTMVKEGEVGAAEVQEAENRILFTNKDNTALYKTAMLPDPDLTRKLLDAGVDASHVDLRALGDFEDLERAKGRQDAALAAAAGRTARDGM